jgi:hypothetical protein
MSLINEALKRTRDATYQASVARPAETDPYRVSSVSETTTAGSRTGLIMMAVIVALVVAGVLFLVRQFILPAQKVRDGFMSSPALLDAPKQSAAPATPPPVAQLVEPPVPVTAPAAPQAAVRTVADEKAGEDLLMAKVIERLKTQPAAPAVPSASGTPALVLQGITSEGTVREAMINGYSLHTGEQIDGATIVAIEAHDVKLQVGDHEVVLRMP